jgi:hypothetical protein
MKKLIISLCVFFMIIISLYLHSILAFDVRDVMITDISGNLEEFKIDGYILVVNKGLFTLFIDEVNFFIVLKENNKTISEGNIPSAAIIKGENNLFFSTDVKIDPAISLATKLLEKGGTYVTFKGNISLRFIPITIPFNEEFDIEPYLFEYTEKGIKKAIGNIFEKFVLIP